MSIHSLEPQRGRSAIAAILDQIDDAVSSTRDKRSFLELVDISQPRLFEELLRSYPRAAYAKLLTLKTLNLLVSKYHFLHRHAALASAPFQLMLDPANSCQLKCPGCIHTENQDLRSNYSWPAGVLDMDTYLDFIRAYGPLAFGVVFYNWGEPLLNKKTPEMVRYAKRYFLHTCISTNLALPIDADALVESGLNFLFISIDGATQETYEKFRRRGQLDICLENIRKIVEAKKRLGRNVPYLLWRFLTFEHSVHEIDLVLETAEELGVDQVTVLTPGAVDWDDPNVKVVRSPRAGRYRFHPEATIKDTLDQYESCEDIDDEVDAIFRRSWVDRARAAGPLEEPSRGQSSTCEWLYQNMTLDAGGRVMPCCLAPENNRHQIYSTYPQDADAFNTKDFKLSRLSFSDRKAFDDATAHLQKSATPFCGECTENPSLTYSLAADVTRDLSFLDPADAIPDDAIARITDWPQSRIKDR